MSNFGERLKELRKTKNMRQIDMADFLGITSRNYQEYEYNKVIPLLPALIKLANYFNVSLDYLVGRSDDPKKH